MSSLNKQRIAIVLPCYNENETIINFLIELNDVLIKEPQFNFIVIVVDDDSTDDSLEMLNGFEGFEQQIDFNLLKLPYNMGHQTAILQGLMHANNKGVDYAIVIDSDGQDNPNEITNLLKFTTTDYQVVNVIRGRREESYLFKILYWIYKLIFKIIIGKKMNFGNYCMISNKILKTTVRTSFIHFAAHISKQKVKSTSILSNRRKRIKGKSKMNLNSLIHHAFKSFIEYAEELLMMFFKAFLIVIVGIVVLFSYIIYQKLFTQNALLGWTSTISFILINIAILCFGFFIIGLLLLNILKQRRDIDKVMYVVSNTKKDSN